MAEGAPEFMIWKDAAGTKNAVFVDVVTGHTDERSAQVSAFPVEFGSDVNDHIVHEPDRLTVMLAQTQTPFETMGPINFTPDGGYSRGANQVVGFSYKPVELHPNPNAFEPAGLLAVSRAIGGAISAGLNALGLTEPDPPLTVRLLMADGPVDRIGELHDKLIEIKQSGYLVTVTYRARQFKDFLLTKVTHTSAPKEVGLGRFTLELQSLRTVSTATAELPDPATLRLKPVKTKNKPAKPVPSTGAGSTPGAAKPKESILSSATGAGV